MALSKIWLDLLSLDVLELDAKGRTVALRYSADSAAGAFAGDVRLQIEEPSEMAGRLFEHLAKETLRQIGKVGPNAVKSNFEKVRGGVLEFLGTFTRVLDFDDLEPMEMALARTAGIDFFSKTVSLWGKELPERVQILLRRAASNYEFGHPEEGRRELAEVELLDPGNSQARALALKVAKTEIGSVGRGLVSPSAGFRREFVEISWLRQDWCTILPGFSMVIRRPLLDSWASGGFVAHPTEVSR